MTLQAGLTTKKAKELQEVYGKNELNTTVRGKLIKKLLHIFSEPIYLLLTCSAIIYNLLGESMDGMIMIAFVIFVIGIDVFQDVRTGNALRKLKEITIPTIRVLRDGKEVLLSGSELVPGDVIFINEGVKIPADGFIIEAVGLCIDESVLTGESAGVWKRASHLMTDIHSMEGMNLVKTQSKTHSDSLFRRDYAYTGTFVILGTGTVLVEKIGTDTEYGKIADKIAKAPIVNSLLQRQMKMLAKQCTYFAAALFVLVGMATFFNLSDSILSERIIHSILAGVVLALSMVPGEFPVILSVFLSMGALRLAKKKALIRSLPTVETLGAISVLCMDKTGTITQNRMTVSDCYIMDRQEGKFCKIMKMTCKTGTFDPVEKALLDYSALLCSKCSEITGEVMTCEMKQKKAVCIKEYAFTNECKAMGQVWRENDNRIIAVKGSPETVLSLCYLPVEKQKELQDQISSFLERGLRVLAIADRTLKKEDVIPETLMECRLFLRGIIGLSDPPREGIEEYMKACQTAGIRIMMITGDHPVTATLIAKTVGIKNSERVITGDELSQMDGLQLREQVQDCNIFARVLPLHKMQIVKALKENGEIVAMTGDGVNDSPAQKTADIGIAMAKYGSEVSREAADLILLDDNLTTIYDTIKDGRRIYQNIVKTVRYIFAIHIPIALSSLAAPILGIDPEALMLMPLHIVLLELVMNPMCSIALERQPAEDHIMRKAPRSPQEHLLSSKRLMRSVLQGVMIFLFSFGSYYGLLELSVPSDLSRTIGFSILVLANIFLVLVNCSDEEPFYRTFQKIKRDRGIMLVNGLTVFGLVVMIYSPISDILGFTFLAIPEVILVIALSAASVLWYEVFKLMAKLINNWKKRKDRLNS